MAICQDERGHPRSTISPEARREVLCRLLALNLELTGEKKAVRVGSKQ